LKYYPLQSHFEPGKIFSLKKRNHDGSHPTLGANERYFEGTIELMDKKKGLEQKPND
jgi:hypothetical protein